MLWQFWEINQFQWIDREVALPPTPFEEGRQRHVVIVERAWLPEPLGAATHKEDPDTFGRHVLEKCQAHHLPVHGDAVAFDGFRLIPVDVFGVSAELLRQVCKFVHS